MNTTTNTITPITLAIYGMTCGHCVQAVTKALAAVPGVKVRSVAVASAVIEAADGGAAGWTAAKAVAALEEAGYPAKALGEAAGAASPMQGKTSGGCCGGAAKAQGASSEKNSGCCGG